MAYGMSTQQYYVVGGEYADTSFTEPAPGTSLERHGPYSEREAKVVWRDLTGKTVDNAMVRYFLKAATDENQKIYFVVGGEYADSSFTKLAEGKQLEVFGPFEKWEALGFWRALTSRSVDDAMVRYDIRKNFNQDDGSSPQGRRSGPVTSIVEIKLSGDRTASVQLIRPDSISVADGVLLLTELESALGKLRDSLTKI
jgi:hypothetical protein